MMDDIRFEVTEEHITLLRNAYVSWSHCEYGAPEINPKRPYGNSDVDNDIAELLNLKPTDFAELEDLLELEDGELPEEMSMYTERLHAETQTALQIFLSTGTMEAGMYESDWRGWSWEKLEY